MINDFVNGGLKMLDVESHFMALKASWIPRILNEEKLIWSQLARYYLQKVSEGQLSKFSFMKKEHFPRLNMIPMFYQEVVFGFCSSIKMDKISNKNDLYNQCIWGNRFLLVDNKCLFSKPFIDAGYIFMRDILLENGKLKPDIWETLKCKSQYLRTISLIQASLKPYKSLRFSDEALNTLVPIENDYNGKKCKWFYNGILSHKAIKAKCINRWNDVFNMNVKWNDIYKNKILKQLEVKFSDMNFKILHNILPTGNNLHKWKKKVDSHCIYCDNQHHDTRHLFYECPLLDGIWTIVGNILQCDITWYQIVIGINKYEETNLIISLICFIILKKFLLDNNKNDKSYFDFKTFLKNELSYRYGVYNVKICNDRTRHLIKQCMEYL